MNAPYYSTRKPLQKVRPVFDSGRVSTGVIGQASGFTPGLTSFGFHRDSRDRREPRSNVTAQILGDPAPGRCAPLRGD